MRTDADRFNRMNRPAQTPAALDQSSAYCVALAVEHAWGEEFTTMLIDILAIESGYRFPTAIFANPVLGDPSDRPIELNIKSRKYRLASTQRRSGKGRALSALSASSPL